MAKRRQQGKGGAPGNVQIDVTKISKSQIDELVTQLKRRPETPVEAIAEDQGTIEGLISLLIVKDIVTLADVQDYGQRYQSAISALIMLCIDKGVFSELELNAAIAAFHHVIRAYGPGNGMTPDEIFDLRLKYTKRLMERVEPPSEDGGGQAEELNGSTAEDQKG